MVIMSQRWQFRAEGEWESTENTRTSEADSGFMEFSRVSLPFFFFLSSLIFSLYFYF